MSTSNIDIIISAQDRASSEVRRLRSEIDELNRAGRNLQHIGEGLFYAGVGMASGLGLAVKQAADFQQEIFRLGAIMGRTYGHMGDLEQIARQFGETTTYSAEEAARAMQLVASYGYEDAKVLKEHTAVAMKLATAQAYDLDLTTDMLISTMKNFQKQGYTSARVADIFTQASNLSSASMDKFRYSLKYVAPIANNLGMSLEDMVAQMSMLYDAGLSAETVGTSLRGIWESLINPTKNAKDVLKKYGLTVDEVNPKLHDMADILDKLKGMSAEDIFKIFGVESAPGIMAMLDQGSQKLRKLRKAYEEAGGALDKQYNTQMKTFNNQLKLAKNNLEEIGIEIGQLLLPSLNKFLQKVMEIMKWFQHLSPETKKFIVDLISFASGFLMVVGVIFKVGGAIAKLIATLKEFGDTLNKIAKASIVAKALEWLGKVVGLLKNGFSRLMPVLGDIGAFFVDNPIGAVIAAIIGVVSLLYTAWEENWFGIRDILKQAWGEISSTFDAIVNSVSQFITDVGTWFQNFDLLGLLQSAWNGIVDWVSNLWQSIKDTIYNFLLQILMDTGQSATEAQTTLQNAWNNLVSFFQGIGNTLYYILIWPFEQAWNFITGGIDWIVQAFQNGWNWISQTVSYYWNLIITWIGNGMAQLKAWIINGLNQIFPYWTNIWNGIKNVASVIWSGIKSVIQGAMSIIRGIISTILNVISAIWSGIWNTIKSVAQSVWNAIKGVVQSAISIIENIIALAINLIAGNWKGAWNNVKNIVKSAWEGIKSIVKGAVNIVAGIIKGAGSTFMSAGRALMNALASGIQSAKSTVYGAVQGVMGYARRLLGFSDAKEGPFSDVTYSGYATMAAFAKGASKAKALLSRSIAGTLSNALSGGAAGLFGINQVGRLGLAGAGGFVEPTPHQTFNITINVHGGGDNINPRQLASQIMEEIQKQMRR